MARKRKDNYLEKAKEFADTLLHQATGGSMGKASAPAPEENKLSFAEKRGLLESLIKIHALEQKSAADNPEEGESAFDIIQREVKNASKKNSSTGSSTTPSGGNGSYKIHTGTDSNPAAS